MMEQLLIFFFFHFLVGPSWNQKKKSQRRRRKSGNASNNFVPEDNTSVLANATHSHTYNPEQVPPMACRVDDRLRSSEWLFVWIAGEKKKKRLATTTTTT
jgi:hypothetical protein